MIKGALSKEVNNLSKLNNFIQGCYKLSKVYQSNSY